MSAAPKPVKVGVKQRQKSTSSSVARKPGLPVIKNKSTIKKQKKIGG